MASSCWVRRNHSATPQIRCDITVGGIRIEMGRQDHGGGGSPAPVEDVPKHRPGLGIERCRRLVQEQYLRSALPRLPSTPASQTTLSAGRPKDVAVYWAMWPLAGCGIHQSTLSGATPA
jgi:hypothetical protein